MKKAPCKHYLKKYLASNCINPISMSAVSNPLDRTSLRVDYRPERGIFTLIAIVAYAIHIPISRNRQQRYQKQ
jgi:hypothetical protein